MQIQNKLKLVGLLIVFSLVISVSSYIFNTYFTSLSLNTNINKIYENELKKKSNLLNNFINYKINYVDIILQSNIFNNYLKKKSDNIELTQIEKDSLEDLFKSIFLSNTNFMQLRYIDKEGKERIRIDRKFKGGEPFFIKNDELQDKKNRYYFNETKEIKDNKVWISNIDLNVENGKIEIPYNPTVRIAKSVYTNSKFDGILIFNIFMKEILTELTRSELFNIFLLDEKGNMIFNKEQKLNWSKYLNTNYNIKKLFPNSYIDILEKDNYSSEILISKKISNNISTNVNIADNLILVFKFINDKKRLMENDIFKYLLYSTILIFLFLIPVTYIFIILLEKLKKSLLDENEDLSRSNYILKQYKKAIDESNIVSIGDLKGNIIYVNDKFAESTLYSKDEVLNKPHSILRGEKSSDQYKDLWETIQNKKIWHGILKNKRKNGEYYHVDITIMPILNQNNEIVEYIAIRHEITDLVNKTNELQKILREDHLTKEGNRFKLFEDINLYKKPSLALLDISSFSDINDFYGHEIGDEILKVISEKIKELFPNNNYSLYRVYSDEFAILSDNINKSDFTNTIKNISDTLSLKPMIIKDKEIFIQTTYNISFESKIDLIKTANMIKKHSKFNKSTIIYDKNLGLEKIYEKNILWTLKIKKALEEDRIVPFYQAIYNVHTNKIEKYECLIRLIDEDDKIISPYFFLDISKKSKQYLKLTKKVIEKSFEYFKDKDYEFSVNLTIKDIKDKDVSSFIIKKLEEYNIGSRVVFEIVESEGIDNFEDINAFIDKVKNLGCKIAIDDFGSGYSNFDYLIKLNANYIKIDGSLIKDILLNKNTLEIIITIIDFAKRQGFKTIAEFVSSEEIYLKVKELGIDYVQGYYISEPKKFIKA